MFKILKFRLGEKSKFNTLIQNDSINNDTLYFTSSENAYELHLGKAKVTDLDNRNMTSLTHSELLSLVNTSKLIPGMQYRIVDYSLICNSIINNPFSESIATYESAGNVFDIIVVADSENMLNEHARATQRDGDRYFANSSLSEWELKYCVFNDMERFDWACRDGKGVIYHMKDEFGNVAPYDFKNIKYLFKRDNKISGISSQTSYYTFDNNGTDMSLSPSCSNNVIGSNKFSNGTSYLCYNVFNNSANVTCTNNVLMNGCFGNTFNSDCNNNILGNYCRENNFGEYCNDNTFGNNCDANVFMNDCDSNHFGNMCDNNVLGFQNRFITFGDECCNNEIRVDSKDGEYMSLCKNIRLDSGCSFVTLYNALRLTDADDTLQLIHVHRGVIGEYSNRRFVAVQRTSAEYEISVSMNSSNEVKVYCIADLIM